MLSMKRILKWGVPLLLILLIIISRWIPAGAEWYARICYPAISAVLSAFSSLFPFSVGDCFIVGACLWLLVYPFYAWWKKKGLRYTLSKMVLFLMWIYIWFYLAWGMNYFRLPFYERTAIPVAEYSADGFRDFLDAYILHLNQSYDSITGDKGTNWYTEPYNLTENTDDLTMANEVYLGYQRIASRYGLVEPHKGLHPKWMLWSGGISRVGVTGYMGPFFSEFNLNRDLLNVEYPFTYAHELAHRLGIAGEAEANLYAALVTTGSRVSEIRFSGYFSLLGYIMRNARYLLSKEDYREVVQQINPEILGIYRQHLIYWRDKYKPLAGKIQNQVYNAYLKGNKIDNGTKNYSEVVGLLMSLRGAGKPNIIPGG